MTTPDFDARCLALADAMSPPKASRRAFGMIGTALCEVVGLRPFPGSRHVARENPDDLGFVVRFWNRAQARWNKTTAVVESWDRPAAVLDAAFIILRSKDAKARLLARRAERAEVR